MLSFLLLFVISCSSLQTDTYKCLPCGRDCDNTVYTKAGSCPDCHMELVKGNTVGFKNVSAATVCDYIKAHPSIVLLDVRTKDEFEGRADPNFGSLKNAINIPIQELEKRIGELEKYKDREILVYCSHSHRSPRASYMLTQHGFTKVTNMSGGMSMFKSGACKK